MLMCHNRSLKSSYGKNKEEEDDNHKDADKSNYNLSKSRKYGNELYMSRWTRWMSNKLNFN